MHFSRSAFVFLGEHGSNVSVLPIYLDKDKMGWGSLTGAGGGDAEGAA